MYINIILYRRRGTAVVAYWKHLLLPNGKQQILWNWQVLKPKSTGTRRRRCMYVWHSVKPFTGNNIIIIDTEFYRKNNTVRSGTLVLRFSCDFGARVVHILWFVKTSIYRTQIAIHRDVMSVYRRLFAKVPMVSYITDIMYRYVWYA